MSTITCPNCEKSFNPEESKKAALDALNSQIQALEEAKKALLEDQDAPANSEVPAENPSELKRVVRKGLGFLGLVDEEDEVAEVGTTKRITDFLGLTDLEPAK